MIEIRIPFKTPTINHLYWHRGNMKIMTKEARALKQEINIISCSSIPQGFMPNKGVALKVDVEIHENWFTKDGSVKKKDISNREKFLIDAIFDALGIDDKFIFQNTMRKIQDTSEFAIIKIWEA
jgi:Holliday junction resolvase RusA-like endonuclease